MVYPGLGFLSSKKSKRHRGERKCHSRENVLKWGVSKEDNHKDWDCLHPQGHHRVAVSSISLPWDQVIFTLTSVRLTNLMVFGWIVLASDLLAGKFIWQQEMLTCKFLNLSHNTNVVFYKKKSRTCLLEQGIVRVRVVPRRTHVEAALPPEESAIWQV